MIVTKLGIRKSISMVTFIFYIIRNKKSNVVIFDPNTNTETIKIANPSAEGRASPQSEYQLFVNRKEQICVMQSAAEVSPGRNIKVGLFSTEPK